MNIRPSRSSLYGHAAVTCSQPLASSAGLHILSQGGTAADAAITMAAVLAVTEPTSNGLGGDFVALVHTTHTTTPCEFFGAGAAPSKLTPTLYGTPPLSPTSALTLTVPGCVAAWFDLKTTFGSPHLSMSELLAPAVRVARAGFFVHDVTAGLWKAAESQLQSVNPCHPMLVPDEREGYRAPRAGEKMINPDLADVLEQLGTHGVDLFYKGWVADAIVAASERHGGVMSLQDLARHRTEIREPVATPYEDWTIWEVGAPSHGIVALLALQIVQKVKERKGKDWDVGLDAHICVEALRLAFDSAVRVIADGMEAEQSVRQLVDGKLALELAELVQLDKRVELPDGKKLEGGGTVQFCAVDKDGGVVSAVQSNYLGFGTGIVPEGCGFTLQNRGLNFSLDAMHANCVGGGRRPYHTIIPGMMVRGQGKEADVIGFGVMGSFMQPQGHLQVIRAMVDDGLDPQSALDRKRLRVTGKFSAVEPDYSEDGVMVEMGIDEEVIVGLRQRGHLVKFGKRGDFGRGHICARRSDGRVAVGAERRADGMGLIWMG